jgi:putative SOS response-associated peptidase YedK
MCGRFLLNSDVEELLERYRAIKGWDMPGGTGKGFPRRIAVQGSFLPSEPPETFPSQVAPVIAGGSQRELRHMKWGFVSPYVKGLIINARGETAAVKPMFREALRLRRCIVPANAYFEWKRDGKKAVKYRISHRNQPIFSMTGIFGDFADKDGSTFTAFSILTTPPNDTLAEIHNRMPLILPREAEEMWLDCRITDAAELKSLFKPYDEEGKHLNIALA